MGVHRHKIMAAFVVLLLSGCSAQYNKSLVARHDGGNKFTPETQCVKNFEILRGLNPALFEKYRDQFDELNKSYKYYQINQSLLDKDPKEIIPLEINAKLKTVCERVKNASYNEIKKRMDVLGGL